MSGPGYSDPVLDHLRAPRFAGSLPRSDPGVRTGEAGEVSEGRLVRIQVRVEIRTGLIREARFKAFGCAATIAAASWLAERLSGQTCDAALAIEAAEIRGALELRDEQEPAAELALQALSSALADGGL